MDFKQVLKEAQAHKDAYSWYINVWLNMSEEQRAEFLKS